MKLGYSTPEPITITPPPVQRPGPEVYVACLPKLIEAEAPQMLAVV